MPRLRRAVAAVLCAVVCAACSGSTPVPAPPVVTPPAAETINGTERLGWSQRAADTVELATVRYAIYVDGARSELAATCDAAVTPSGFGCSARLPTLTAGAHTLELASFVNDGGILESARSAALRVRVTTSTAQGESQHARRLDQITSDGVTLHVDLVAEGLTLPTDLAFLPDGRMLIGEHHGEVRVVRDGVLLDEPALSLRDSSGSVELLALAVNPPFSRAHFVFMTYAATRPDGGRSFVLARFREVADTLGDRVILLDGIPAGVAEASAALRFGPDARLYAAFDAGLDPRASGDLSTPNGKILRLNSDGSTPDDQAGLTPLYASAFVAPAGMDWQSPSALWMADREAPDRSTLKLVVPERDRADGKVRGVIAHAFSLPAAARSSSMTIVPATSRSPLAGNLLVASREGQALLRVRFDPLNQTRIAGTELLLENLIGPIRVVAARPDGAIYFVTADAIYRMAW